MSKKAIEEYMDEIKAFAESHSKRNLYVPEHPTFSFSDYLKWLELKKLDEISKTLQSIAAKSE